MPSNYAVEGLILRGVVREVSRYERTRDKARMIGMKILVEGPEYRTTHEVSVPEDGVPIPAKGNTVEVLCASRVTKSGDQYLTGYDGGLEILDSGVLVAAASR